MTIDDMIERLQEYRCLHGGETIVRLMTQRRYPMAYETSCMVSGAEINAESDVVFITEGDQVGYGTKLAWEHAS